MQVSKTLNSKQRRAVKQAAKIKQAAEDGFTGLNDTITGTDIKSIKGGNKGMGSTGKPSGGYKVALLTAQFCAYHTITSS